MPQIARKPTSSPTPEAEISRLDIDDCQSIFEVVDFIRQFRSTNQNDAVLPAPGFDYRACHEILNETRGKIGFLPSQNTLAVATIDPDSEGQARFISAISKLGILVEPVDFRDASVTLPLMGDLDRSEKRYVRTLAPNIAFAIGLVASRSSAEVVVVTRAFELYRPLVAMVQNEKRRGKAAIAFFRRFLDPRFGIAGLFEPDSPVKFIDLDPFSERLVGCDVRQLGGGPKPKVQGIAGL
jgi:hypothetical protein